MFILLAIFCFMVMAASVVFGFGWFYVSFAWIFRIIFWVFLFALIGSLIAALLNRGKQEPPPPKQM